ncbi:MAG: ABC transporter substrate-binding protein, partial [Dysgonamonadaceae bacterium]|nr:ABC transporter substrate-binding protein [Dysgonamonadaceae bacterium]
MNIKSYLLFFICFSLFFSCDRKNRQTNVLNQTKHNEAFVRYAQEFSVHKTDDYTEITIMNPWVRGTVLRHYILVDKTKKMPENLPEGIVIRVPLGRVVCYSSVQCSVLDELGVIDSIVGICEPQYVGVPIVREKIKNGTIVDLGMASNPDIEKIMLINPDAILTSPLKEVGYGKVESVGIPIIDCIDYMESTPLGRAEWIRFHALLFGKEMLADSLFTVTEQSYKNLKMLASSVKKRPTVVTEKKYGNVWHLPG